MAYSQLITSLQATAERLHAARISEVDFEQLGADLDTTIMSLHTLTRHAEAAQRLTGLFKEELSRKARATARLTGRQSNLIERQINAEDISLSELISLKHDIDKEFDAVFSRKLHEPTGAAGGGDKILEFKV